MEEMNRMMEAIDEGSQKIASITSMIDGVAFQTNFLALNAAVEAARAGEHGRGFAVVASEVRNLSQRSATAASEIKALIEASAGQIAAGQPQANQSGETMNTIVEQVQQVTSLMAQISSATAEQATALSEVSQAVEELDQITHNNALRVDEGASESDRVARQVTPLVDAICVFR